MVLMAGATARPRSGSARMLDNNARLGWAGGVHGRRHCRPLGAGGTIHVGAGPSSTARTTNRR
jgi:hypothetical protein